MNRTRVLVFLLFVSISAVNDLFGQEFVGPLQYNPVLFRHDAASRKKPAAKTTATLSLPFFEDFTGNSPYPDSNKWQDFEVFINNTMCSSPISKGVATFDALNAHGIPYDSFNNANFRYADSLTSQPIDMSADSSTDSVYLSFFYQPQGNGFFPLLQDSLFLYLKNRYGDYVEVWSAAGPPPGTPLQPLQQVMIPITDSLYFHSAFQFRFVNIAALFWADAVWNVDYIRLDRNRGMYDTTVNDVGFTADPTFYLNDYTSMPYRQFFVNTTGEISGQFTSTIRNNYGFPQSISHQYNATVSGSGALLYSSPVTATAFGAQSTQQSAYPTYSTVIAPPAAQAKVVFENKFFIQSVSPLDPPGNDTIVKSQVFDNYLAYDDGTAEKSYYLNLFPTLPGKIAVEYHLNRADTLRGLAIYFGRQIPFASYKSFTIIVYSALKGINGATADNILYQQELYSPAYADSVNHFWYYSFDKTLVLPAGTFYTGTLQPAESSSDSLYFGLDVNRIGGNHAYYNVVGSWAPSLISGAIIIRPLLGQSLTYVGVDDLAPLKKENWQVIPNPATDRVRFEFNDDGEAPYFITDMIGRAIMHGSIKSGGSLDVSSLSPGIYFVNLLPGGTASTPQKLIKL